MSPKRLLQPSWWAGHWPNAILYIAVTGVFVLTVWGFSRQTQAAREADIRWCRSSNERTALILEYILKGTVDPDPRQYEFIADPVLRQGAIDQARRGRAEQRERATRTFTQRDCDAEFPPT